MATTKSTTALVLTYTKQRETKNTVVFQNDLNERDAYYVQKSDMQKYGFGDQIKITVEANS